LHDNVVWRASQIARELNIQMQDHQYRPFRILEPAIIVDPAMIVEPRDIVEPGHNPRIVNDNLAPLPWHEGFRQNLVFGFNFMRQLLGWPEVVAEVVFNQQAFGAVILDAQPAPIVRNFRALPQNTDPRTIIQKELEKLSADQRDNFARSLLCPITREIMVDPVMVIETGQTYDRQAIQTWFATSNLDPVTQVRVSNKAIRDNVAVRQTILERIQELLFFWNHIPMRNMA
jgi:hypothetical protein